jgi:O-antigen ligase
LSTAIQKTFQHRYFEDIFLLAVSILSFLCWQFSNEWLGVIGFTTILISIAYSGKAIYFLPIPIFAVPMFRGLLKNVGKIANASDVITVSVLLIVSVGVGAIVYDIIKHKRFQKKGALFFSWLLVIGSMLLSLINTVDLVNSISGMMIYVFMLFFYVYFFNVASSNSTSSILFSKTILYFTSVTAIMTLVVILYEKNIIDSIIKKDINIGWSISNNIATYIVFGIPFILYLSLHAKQKFIYYFLVILHAVVLFMTGSRAGIGGLLILIIPAVIYTLNKTDRKQFVTHLLLAFLLTMPFVFVAIYMNIPEALYNRLFVQKFFFYYDDRKRLLEIAMECFKQFPLFGSGVFSAGHYIQAGGRNVFSYHNIFFEILASLGITGLLAFLYFSVSKYIMLLSNLNSFKIYGLMAVVASSIFAFVDTSFLNPIYLYMLFVFFAFAEKSEVQ